MADVLRTEMQTLPFGAANICLKAILVLRVARPTLS
jgi:hypothetical protein